VIDRIGATELFHLQDRLDVPVLAPPGTSLDLRPPPQLVFSLASVWPGAEINYASSWEEAEEQALADAKPDEDLLPVFIAWSPRGRVRGAAPAANLRLAAPPFLYRSLEVAAYMRDRASLTPVGAANDEISGRILSLCHYQHTRPCHSSSIST
jgi:hypothetical protein